MASPNSQIFSHRSVCQVCRKSTRTCYCMHLRPFDPGIEIVILQHPYERRKAIGTGRMAHLTLKGSHLITGSAFDSLPRVQALLADSSKCPVVLFPGPRSRDAKDFVADHPALKTLTVFVIDGTWASAKKMLRLSPRIAELPQIRFTPERPSEYLIRKQPAPHCLSTIEAVHRLLEVLRPETNPDRLLEVFRKMVLQQARFVPVDARISIIS